MSRPERAWHGREKPLPHQRERRSATAHAALAAAIHEHQGALPGLPYGPVHSFRAQTNGEHQRSSGGQVPELLRPPSRGPRQHSRRPGQGGQASALGEALATAAGADAPLTLYFLRHCLQGPPGRHVPFPAGSICALVPQRHLHVWRRARASRSSKMAGPGARRALCFSLPRAAAANVLRSLNMPSLLCCSASASDAVRRPTGSVYH